MKKVDELKRFELIKQTIEAAKATAEFEVVNVKCLLHKYEEKRERAYNQMAVDDLETQELAREEYLEACKAIEELEKAQEYLEKLLEL